MCDELGLKWWKPQPVTVQVPGVLNRVFQTARLLASNHGGFFGFPTEKRRHEKMSTGEIGRVLIGTTAPTGVPFVFPSEGLQLLACTCAKIHQTSLQIAPGFTNRRKSTPKYPGVEVTCCRGLNDLNHKRVI